jgi:DNA-binding NarL/FixJ family response regulator
MVTSVAIIDQELTFADALAFRLEAENDIKVVAVATTSPGSVPEGYADIILLDADLADDMASLLCGVNASPETRVVMLSHTSEPARIIAAIQAGAAAWIRKDEPVGHLLELLRGVARGQTWLPVAETGNVLSLLLRPQDSGSDDGMAPAALTLRERQVLDCLADGAGRSEVATRLRISVNTVRTHLQNIMTKLGVHSTLEAIAMVRRPSRRRPDLDERFRLAADRTALLHQHVAETANALCSAAADTVALLEQQADLVGQPGDIDYPAMVKRWQVVVDQASGGTLGAATVLTPGSRGGAATRGRVSANRSNDDHHPCDSPARVWTSPPPPARR